MSKNVSLPQLGRRRLLAGASVLGGAALGAVLPARGEAASAKALLPLTAQTTEGPFYFDPQLVRADITEGLPGVPIEVRFAVMDQAGVPYAGARVDIWHCDAAGLYSGYAGQGDERRVSTKGKTFLRGTLISGKDGVAVFRSIYPGWYEGRATHIHFKVLDGQRGQRTVLTSQLFLPDALSEYLYTQLPAYRRAHLRGTLNSNDGIALQAGDTVVGAVRQEAERYVATLNVVVDRNAHSVIGLPPVLGAGPPPDGTSPQAEGLPPGFMGGHPHELEGQARLAAMVPGQAKQAW